MTICRNFLAYTPNFLQKLLMPLQHYVVKAVHDVEILIALHKVLSPAFAMEIFAYHELHPNCSSYAIES